MQMNNGKKEYLTMWRRTSSAIAKLSTTSWFTQSTGSKNGVVLVPLVKVLDYPLTSNMSLNHFLTVLSTSLSILLLTCFKVIFGELSLEFSESGQKILPMTSGVIFSWEKSIQVTKYLNTNWTS